MKKPTPRLKFNLEQYIRANLNCLGWREESFASAEDFTQRYPTREKQIRAILNPGETYLEDVEGNICVFDGLDAMLPTLNYKYYDIPWTEDELYFLDKLRSTFGPSGHLVRTTDLTGKHNALLQYVCDYNDKDTFILDVYSSELSALVEQHKRALNYKSPLLGHLSKEDWYESSKWRPYIATRFISKSLKEYVTVRANKEKSIVYLSFRVLNIPGEEVVREDIDSLPKELTITLSFKRTTNFIIPNNLCAKL